MGDQTNLPTDPTLSSPPCAVVTAVRTVVATVVRTTFVVRTAATAVRTASVVGPWQQLQ